MKIKKKWDLMTDEDKRRLSKALEAYFLDEKGESLDLIAADSLIDLFLENAAIGIYNKGVEDSISFLKKRMEDIELDMDLLRK